MMILNQKVLKEARKLRMDTSEISDQCEVTLDAHGKTFAPCTLVCMDFALQILQSELYLQATGPHNPP